ncbi:hypothetical protein ELQ35_17335 [Peribacillus cavernae]|uniref:Uncharacterized protein n=1 Tax=Peribacillus cavernae TaxID=1674310 RepID=A0A3S1B2E5_9BACI|nr:hypothetical protein [Peribacillus cavernae]MDQ0219463.1 hypothetical protein [Peribacillus cavernae]RUQ27114.1 hypothetical protein ELQ35_17335 [Peribacillus cavernae]
MIFTSINQDNLYQLCDAFEGFLIDHDITFTYVDMTEENGIISFLFANDPEKGRVVEFEGKNSIGLETEYIAKEVLAPILPRLKAYSKIKSS